MLFRSHLMRAFTFETETFRRPRLLTIWVCIMTEETQSDITALTVQLLSAFVSNNTVSSEGLSDLIKSTRAALTETPTALAEEPAAETFAPAVSVRKSLSSPDHIISLIDGKPYKTLKRHLATRGLTPDQYRERYNLPKSYPLVAPSYSEARRAVAEKLGLGKKPAITKATKPVEEVIAAEPVTAAEAKVQKAPRKATAVPSKKQPSKAKVATATKSSPAVSASSVTTPATVAPVLKDGRKRLSIATAKEAKVETKPVKEGEAAAHPNGKAKAASKKAAPITKGKAVSKPKSLKSAREAAGAHLNANTKAAEPSKAD